MQQLKQKGLKEFAKQLKGASSVCAKFARTGSDDKKYDIDYYNIKRLVNSKSFYIFLAPFIYESKIMPRTFLWKKSVILLRPSWKKT